MGKTIALMNEKGGVGKSSVTYSVAWYLAEQDKKVLIVDMDGQMASITYLSGVETNDDTLTMYDVLLRNKDADDAVLRVSDELELFIIPSTNAVADTMTTAKISRMKKVIQGLRGEYDYIFFDVNPSPDWKHALTLSVSDYVGIVMLPDVLSLEANMGIVDSIEEVQANSNSNLKVLGIIMNQFNTQTNLAKAVEDKASAMAEHLQTSVLKSKIRKAVAMGESASAHVGITAYAGRSDIANDVRSLTCEIEDITK